MAKKRKVSFDELPNNVQKIVFDESNAIDQETLLKEIVDGFGGPKEIANTVAKEFKDAVPGGITRQRIIEMITRLVVNVSESNSMLVKRASDMTDNELKDIAVRFFGQALEAKEAKDATRKTQGCGPQQKAPVDLVAGSDEEADR